MALENFKKEAEVSTRESTNLTESKIVVSLPHLVLFSKVFMDLKWLRPQIEAKNLEHFRLNVKFTKGLAPFTPSFDIKTNKETKSSIFKKYVSIKRAGLILKSSIKSCLSSQKQPRPKLLFSQLLNIKDFLKRNPQKSISKISYFNVQKKDLKAEAIVQSKKIMDLQGLKHKKNRSSMDIKASFGTAARVSPPKQQNYGLSKFKSHRGHLKQKSVLQIQKPRFVVENAQLMNDVKDCYFQSDKTTAYNSTTKTPQKSLNSSWKLGPSKPEVPIIAKQQSKKPQKMKMKVGSQKNIFRF